MASRQDIIRTYRNKSDESYRAARACLDSDCYRAACNRAWYSLVQMVTACTYQCTSNTPTSFTRVNWSHNDTRELLRDLIAKADPEHIRGMRYVLPSVDYLLDLRNIADYEVPDDKTITKSHAQEALAIAGHVRKRLLHWMTQGIEA